MSDHVAVVIVGYRCHDEIKRCIEALSHSSHSSFEVHVCENGGPDAYEALVDTLAGSDAFGGMETEPSRSPAVLQSRRTTLRKDGQAVHLHLTSGNLGYAGGVNAGIASLAGDNSWSAVWVLNPDTEVHERALEALVACARDERYGIIGSRMILAGTGQVQLYGGRWRRWMGRGYNIGLGSPADAKPDVAAIERDMDYVSGAAMFVPRRYIEAVGPMDERYFLYNEEVDWCFRRGSFRLGYAHDAIIHHQHGATMGSSHSRRQQSPLSVYLDERNKLLFTRRFFQREFPFVLLITLGLTSQYLVSGAFSNFGHALAGWLAGVRGQEGPPARFVRREAGASAAQNAVPA
jgi:GT2 family glycosyltransferase